MITKSLFSALLTLLILLPSAVYSQNQIGIKSLDALVRAVNAQDSELLKPFITERTKIGDLPANLTEQVLRQILTKVGKIESANLIRKENEQSSTRYFVSFRMNGTDKEYNFLLDADDKFIELNIVKATVKRIENKLEGAVFPQKIEVPFQMAGKLLVVQAEIDGKKGDFILDSGAPLLFLNQEYFKAPNGENTVSSNAKGATGSLTGMSYYKAKIFNWSGITISDKDIPTIDISHIEKNSGDKQILGLIGFNLLEKYAVTFDYQNKKLILQQAGAEEAAKPVYTTAFTMKNHLPVVEMRLGGKTLRLAIDSGAESNLIDKKYQAELSKILAEKFKDNIWGASKETQTVEGGVIKSGFLDNAFEFKNMRTEFSDITHLNTAAKENEQEKIDGILGYEFLRQYKTTLDFPRKMIRFYK